jgi:predicted metal-dependent phosphoesterase TrpH
MDNFSRVQFEQPDLNKLSSNFTVVDLHFHTNHSDGLNSVKAVAERARELGIGVAITDHNEIQGAVEIAGEKNLLTIPGIEITSTEGTHLLVYFYSIAGLKKFYKNDLKPYMGHDVMSSTDLTMEEIIQRARKYNSVVIFPHPYCAMYTGVCNYQFSAERLDTLLQMCDGIEAINSENLKKWNLKSALLGFNLNKALTGGSDGHTLYHMGRVVTYSDCIPTRKAFLDAIKEKQTKVIGKEISLLRKVTSNGLKLKTSLRNCPDLVEKNIKYGCKVINLKSRLLKDNVIRHFNGKNHDEETTIYHSMMTSYHIKN